MYIVTFEDTSIFKGGEPSNSLWNTMPDKKITKIEYILGQRLILTNYKMYNHLVEKINVLGQETVTKILLMGNNDGNIDCFTMDMNRHYGFFIKSHVIYSKEYNDKITTGWKLGEKTDNSTQGIFKIINNLTN